MKAFGNHSRRSRNRNAIKPGELHQRTLTALEHKGLIRSFRDDRGTVRYKIVGTVYGYRSKGPSVRG
jgi:hypothetical protein